VSNWFTNHAEVEEGVLMVRNGKIYLGQTADGREIVLLPAMANPHGLIAGATGTGKTVTLKVLAESFSDLGVPVFLADVKGDLAGMVDPGQVSDDMEQRIRRFGLAGTGFAFHAYPAVFWDVYGKRGMQLRTTISEMGPVLLARILGLNEIQSQILTILFRIADEEQLLLVDTKDLRAMLNYLNDHREQYRQMYGNIAPASIAAILRAVAALEMEGGDLFFGEPALDIRDFFTLGSDGRGMINILDSGSLVNHPALYSTFLLWMLSELFETLPEVGDVQKPKMVFFFDEAHLLFDSAPKELLDKIEQIVRLIRSKGVGIFFITQNPTDVPEGVSAQLNNKIEHGLRAYTPAEQKKVRAAAESMRANPDFDTAEAILNLGIGEAVVSFLDEQGMPGISEKIAVLPPQSRMGAIEDARREQVVKESVLYSKYAVSTDPDSAYEFLQRRGLEEQARAEKEASEAAAAKEQARADAAAAKEQAKAAAAAEREKARADAAQEKARERAEAAEVRKKAAEEKKAENARKRAVKSMAGTVSGTIGREVGKQIGGSFGKFGKTLGGNIGASLGRGILSTLFKN